jgi:hypothetical protein
MLSEKAAQNVTITSRTYIRNLADYNIKLRTKNGMVYQMYSTPDESLRYQIIESEGKVCLFRVQLYTICLIRTFKFHQCFTSSVLNRKETIKSYFRL